ncbi:hypothetical protein [Staphylococcus agnetis]|uniref:Uncharacterized protein n=1 Tax=Staphylococcus agnetis TaxID=985762 RepID=A0ABX3Z6A4_9STAP|nr:hypothetical protein [Staphylococcus agnetis]ALN77549.1 hypothetical protein EP23_09400 [Staphylococcus agnetis]OSP19064.1 hypothetical protein B9L42_08180 [Staphylococcus agnetis]OSP24373.1 hypothetical protein B9M87_03305 [Staphylococcus agnetis]OTW31490.1 hypothetical protein B9M88_04195 [Staphylococcus agnetis]
MELWVKLIWFLIAAALAVYFIFDERIISLIILLLGNILVFIIIEFILKKRKDIEFEIMYKVTRDKVTDCMH